MIKFPQNLKNLKLHKIYEHLNIWTSTKQIQTYCTKNMSMKERRNNFKFTRLPQSHTKKYS